MIHPEMAESISSGRLRALLAARREKAIHRNRRIMRVFEIAGFLAVQTIE